MQLYFLFWRNSPQWARASSFLRFLDHTQRRTTIGRTPLDEWSARRRDLYLTTHNTHKRQTSMSPVGFELIISASERPQTYALGGVATGTGANIISIKLYYNVSAYFISVNWRLELHMRSHFTSNHILPKRPTAVFNFIFLIIYNFN